MADEYIKVPPFNLLKKEYSVNNGFGKSEYISKYFFLFFLSFLRDISKTYYFQNPLWMIFFINFLYKHLPKV